MTRPIPVTTYFACIDCFLHLVQVCAVCDLWCHHTWHRLSVAEQLLTVWALRQPGRMPCVSEAVPGGRPYHTVFTLRKVSGPYTPKVRGNSNRICLDDRAHCQCLLVYFRWLHTYCDSIRNEDEAEKAAEFGYHCLLCRPITGMPGPCELA